MRLQRILSFITVAFCFLFFAFAYSADATIINYDFAGKFYYSNISEISIDSGFYGSLSYDNNEGNYQYGVGLTSYTTDEGMIIPDNNISFGISDMAVFYGSLITKSDINIGILSLLGISDLGNLLPSLEKIDSNSFTVIGTGKKLHTGIAIGSLTLLEQQNAIPQNALANPEPSTFMLFVVGIAFASGFLMYRYKKNRQICNSNLMIE